MPTSWWLVFDDLAAAPLRGGATPAVPLPDGTVVVGRDDTCDVILLGGRISRRHCAFEVAGDAVTVRDFDSVGGVLVDGAQAAPTAPCRDGSVIDVGSCRLSLVRSLPTPTRLTPAAGLSSPSPSTASDSVERDDCGTATFRAFLDSLRSAGDPRQVVERLLRGTAELTGAERGFVLLDEDGAGRFVSVASIMMHDGDEQAAISTTVCRRAVEAASTLVIDNSASSAACQGAASLAQAVKPRAIVCAALRYEGRAIGVLYLDRAALPNGGFAPAVVGLVDTVTGFTADLVGAERTRRNLLATRNRLQALKTIAAEDERFIVGTGPAAARLRELLEAAAGQDITVLVTGETGTGKEMVAKALHRLSPRRGGTFVPVHCAALPRDILEAELFGVRKGAFTGADEDRMGRFELAAGGTLFLDEVGDVPLDVQVKLLRVLQEQTVTRLGASAPTGRLDFRLVCATNVDLEAAVREGSFRQDLYYRVNVLRLELPPLRERGGETILSLAEYFLEAFAGRCKRSFPGSFTTEARELLCRYPWPGNIRELRNAIERAVVVERGDAIGIGSLPVGKVAVPERGSLHEFLEALPNDYDAARDEFDRQFFKMHLEKSGGNQRAMSRDLNIARNTLARRLKKIGLT